MRSIFHKFDDDRRGSVAITFALTAVSVFGVVGFAIDYGRAMHSTSKMRGALDAAVLAASNIERDKQVGAAEDYFAANFTNNFAAGTTVPRFYRNGTGGVDGTVTAFVKTNFASIFGIENFAVVVSASSKPTTRETETVTVTNTTYVPGGIPCIHVLDQNGTSFKLDSNSNLNLGECEAHVRSNNSIAMSNKSSSNVKFKKVLVKGGIDSTAGITIKDSPYVIQTNAQVVGDPYLPDVNDVRQQITVGGCTAANTGKVLTGTVQPGTYCGATEFKGVHFTSGLYIITDAGGNKNGSLKITGAIDGSAGVSFYLHGNKTTVAQISPNENSKLYAPSTGLTRGLLIFENSNRGNNWDWTIASCNKQGWMGLIYLPSANLKLQSLSEWEKFQISITANQLSMISVSSVMQPFAWTPYGKNTPIGLSGEYKTTTSTETHEIEKSKYLLR